MTSSSADIERVGRFLDGISRGVVTELSQLLGQQVAYWRFKNAVTIALKAQDFLESKRLEPQQLSAELRVIVPLLEYASYEDEPELRQMWASLLAASVSPAFDSSMHPKYSEVLKQLSPLEARLLKDMYDTFNQNGGYWVYARSEPMEERIGIPAEKLEPFLANLDRLNLVQARFGDKTFFVANIYVCKALFQRFYEALYVQRRIKRLLLVRCGRRTLEPHPRSSPWTLYARIVDSTPVAFTPGVSVRRARN